MTITEEVLAALPSTESGAINAAALFKLCKGADDVKTISTALSQLYAAKQINRKVQIQGQSRYVYWNAIPVEEPHVEVAPIPVVLAQSPSLPPANVVSLAGLVEQVSVHKSEPPQSEARVIGALEKESEIAKRLLAYQEPPREAEQFTKADAELLDELIKQNPLDVQIGGDHYEKLGDYQPWKVFKAWMTPEELKGAMKKEVIWYLAREKDKGGRQDIEKALHTIQIYIQLTEGEVAA